MRDCYKNYSINIHVADARANTRLDSTLIIAIFHGSWNLKYKCAAQRMKMNRHGNYLTNAHVPDVHVNRLDSTLITLRTYRLSNLKYKCVAENDENRNEHVTARLFRKLRNSRLKRVRIGLVERVEGVLSVYIYTYYTLYTYTSGYIKDVWKWWKVNSLWIDPLQCKLLNNAAQTSSCTSRDAKATLYPKDWLMNAGCARATSVLQSVSRDSFFSFFFPLFFPFRFALKRNISRRTG